jgi:hypothetical protein
VPARLPKKQRPSFAAPLPPAKDDTRQRWTEAKAVAGMIRFLDSAPAKSTRRAYVSYASGNRDACPASALKPFGGFVQVKAFAEKKRRKSAQPAPGG